MLLKAMPDLGSEMMEPETTPLVTPPDHRMQSRKIWERVMGCASSPVKYEKTCVLLLGWVDEVDDIEAGRELESLQEVLESFYEFSVQFKRLHLEKHPQVQAAKHVADFIHDEDESGRLLIIYYGGHGDSEATAPGRIKLAGRIPDDDAERDMCIEWNDIESSVLTKTKADVLVIFDCCYAGVLCRPAFRGPRRTFQYVAACTAWQRTKSAGPESFTSAMIWALRNLASLKAFTVTKLVDTLMEHESFPRDTQEAIVYGSRFGPVDEDIWISETQTKGTGDSGASSTHPEQRISSVRDDVRATADILDLRFHFSEPATKSNIEDTARALKKLLLANEDLRFHRITFLDHTSFIEWPVKHWLRQTRMKKTGARAGPTPVVSTEDSKDADSETRDDQRMQHLPGIGTSDVKHPLIEVDCWAEKATNDDLDSRVLYDLGIAFRLFVNACRPPPAWHSQVFVVIL